MPCGVAFARRQSSVLAVGGEDLTHRDHAHRGDHAEDAGPIWMLALGLMAALPLGAVLGSVFTSARLGRGRTPRERPAAGRVMA
jgi:hypothetical protein